MKIWFKVMLIMVLMLVSLAGGQAYAAGKGKAEVKDKKLQFVDEAGKVVRSIPLGEEFREVPKKGTKAKIRQWMYKRVSISRDSTWLGAKDSVPDMKKILKDVANPSGNYAAILTDIRDSVYIDETGQEHPIDEGTRTGDIRVFDGMGNVLWTKQLQEGWGIYGDAYLSDGGEALAVQISGDAMGTDEVTDQPLYVYDRTGKVIMSAPTKEDVAKWPDLHIIGIEAISPNGKYLAVSVDTGCCLEARFYNLHNGRYWNAAKSYVVYWIANSGEAHVGNKNVSGESEDIDLKNYLGD